MSAMWFPKDGAKVKPLKLHSIFLTGHENCTPAIVPDKIRRNIDSFIEVHPNSEHVLYTDMTLRMFIKDHFDRPVLDAYDELVPLAYKADLGRYCILYTEGGIYSDIANHFFHGLCADIPDAIYVFRDMHSKAPWIVSTTIIAAPPELPVFKKCIERICRHTIEQYYGVNALCPTGPNLFGNELAASTPLHQIRNGLAVHVNTGFNIYPALALVSDQGDMIAYRNKTSAGINTLGVDIDYTYDQLYDSRRIYKSERNRPRIYWGNDYYAKRQLLNGSLCRDGNSVLLTNIRGIAIYGPYIMLKNGNYTAEFSFSGGSGCADRLIGSYDIVTDYGKTNLCPSAPFKLKLTAAETMLSFGFSLPRNIDKCEIRINIHSNSTFRFHCLKIYERS